MAVTPSRTRAGVLGITRMRRASLCSPARIFAVETPAAIEIRSLRRVTAGAISFRTASMIWGFTARMTMSQWRTTAALSDETWMPYWRSSSFSRSSAHVGRVDRARRHEARSEEALDQCFAHVAAADEPDGEALDRHRSSRPGSRRGARGPKIAVPTRTMVAPSSIATSKSPLIPIESSVNTRRSACFRSAGTTPASRPAPSPPAGSP